YPQEKGKQRQNNNPRPARRTRVPRTQSGRKADGYVRCPRKKRRFAGLSPDLVRLIWISHRGRAPCPHRAGASRPDGALGQTRLTDRLLTTATRGEECRLSVRFPVRPLYRQLGLKRSMSVAL